MKNYIKILFLGMFAIASCAEVETPVIEGSEIVLNETSITLGLDSTYVLTATILPVDATDTTIIWKSTKDSVAVVDDNGLVTAVGKGTAYIIASNTASSLKAACMVTVIKILPGQEPSKGLKGQDPEEFGMGDMEWMSIKEELNQPSDEEQETPPSDEEQDKPSDEEQETPPSAPSVGTDNNEDFNMDGMEWENPEDTQTPPSGGDAEKPVEKPSVNTPNNETFDVDEMEWDTIEDIQPPPPGNNTEEPVEKPSVGTQNNEKFVVDDMEWEATESDDNE